MWKKVKKTYCASPEPLRTGILLLAFLRLWGPMMVRDLLKGRPLATWRSYGHGNGRGMSSWRDMVDWVGGYPFKVAKPEDIFNFYQHRGVSSKFTKNLRGWIRLQSICVFSRCNLI